MAVGEWVQKNKIVFLAIALSLMTLSFGAAIYEFKKKDNLTGLIVFSFALVITASLLSYNKIRYGYFI